MRIISEQVRYWKSLSRLEFVIVLLILLGGAVKLLKLLLGGA